MHFYSIFRSTPLGNGYHLAGHRRELPVFHYHEIMEIYPYPFFVEVFHFFSCIIFNNDCICILTGSPVYYLFMIMYFIQKIGGNANSIGSLNLMVNCNYHG